MRFNAQDLGIIVFGHSRASSMEAVLTSLDRSGHIGQVTAWIDGHQNNPQRRPKVEEVQSVVRKFDVAESVFHVGALGFRKQVLHGLAHMCERYEIVLVLEDDCFPSSRAIESFVDKLNETASLDNVATVYGHHFKTKSEHPFCPRFQGWGWAFETPKMLASFQQLRQLYSLPESEYLMVVRELMTDNIRKRIDVTPPRLPSYCLDHFFAWDETLGLICALKGQTHAPTDNQVVFNFGLGDGGQSFSADQVEKFRSPPFNMIREDQVWDVY